MRIRALIAYGSAFVVLVVAGLAFWTMSLARASDEWVTHSERITATLRAVQGELVEAEAAERGYILTGDERYLEPYDQAQPELDHQMAVLSDLVTEEPAQEKRLADLRSLVAEKRAALAETIHLRDASGAEAAADSVRSGRGKLHMDAVRAVVGEMEAYESASLLRREALRDAWFSRASWTIGLGSVAACLLAVLVHYWLEREIRRRERNVESLSFLAEGSQSLASSLELTQALGNFTRSVVPRFASCAIIYTKNGEGLSLAAVAHVDPDKEAMIRRFFEGDTKGGVARGFARAIVEDKATLVSSVTEADLVRNAADEQSPALLRDLGARSYIVVPLRVQARTLGALIFAITAEGRRYGEDDRLVAEELARRTALAIDNARLFDEARVERERAEGASRTKDEFLAVVSHELRTPLNAILGWAGMLRGGVLSAERQKQALEVIERNAHAQAQLVEDILDMSRIISGRLRLRLAMIDVVAVVDAALDAVRPAAEAKDVRLAREGDGPIFLAGDADRLQQLVWNLLNNSVKFTPRGGDVCCAVTVVAGAIRISVVDTGVGIDAAFLPQMFDRFRQADASPTRAHGGLGLGLSIVRHIAELHGGRVEARSAGPGSGAEFIVTLPHALEAPIPLPSETRLARGPEQASPGLRVLVLDDERDTRELLSAMLTARVGRVWCAANAQEALALVQRERPDVIVSDIAMPGEDGYTFIRKLRELPPGLGGQTPAIALTAYAREEDRRHALAAGYQVHLAKPVESGALLGAIASVRGPKTVERSTQAVS